MKFPSFDQYMEQFADKKDYQHANLVRTLMGRNGKLVSWEQRDDGSWLARLSCAEIPVTVARAGNSRLQAIQRANKALHFLLGADLED